MKNFSNSNFVNQGVYLFQQTKNGSHIAQSRSHAAQSRFYAATMAVIRLGGETSIGDLKYI
jgi:hypothetical protein